MRKTLVCASILLLAQPCWKATAHDASCFKADEKPQFRILEQAPPPRTNEALPYNYYPASIIATTRIDLIQSSEATMPLYYWQWANHGPRRVPKSNLAIDVHPGVGTSLFFSTIARANACTMAQTAALFADETQVRTNIDRSNLRQTSQISAGEFTDVCPIRDYQLPSKAEGVLLDYEVIDGRAPSESERFLVDFANYVHSKGKKAILYTNPLDAGTQRLTGINQSNAATLAKAFDLMSIFLWSKNRQGSIAASFEAQKALIRPWQPEKIMTVFELNNTTLQDAASVSRLMKANSISVVSLWRNYARQGGSCDLPVNMKIACLAFGHC